MKNRQNQPKGRGTTLWHVMLIAHSGQPRYVRVNELGRISQGEIIQSQQVIRSIRPQTAARRFIRKRLQVVAVLQDDGANDLSDALGGQHTWCSKYTKVKDAKRYRKNRFRAMCREMPTNIGGTYGVKVVYE